MKYGLWPEIIIFKKISTENAQQYVASGEDLIGDRLRLDILTKIFKRIFNKDEVWSLRADGLVFVTPQESFSVFSVCSVDSYGIASQEIFGGNL